MTHVSCLSTLQLCGRRVAALRLAGAAPLQPALHSVSITTSAVPGAGARAGAGAGEVVRETCRVWLAEQQSQRSGAAGSADQLHAVAVA